MFRPSVQSRQRRCARREVPLHELLETRTLLSAAPQLVGDINTTPLSGDPRNSVTANGLTFFVADDGVHGAEVWRTDGTPGGTLLLKDVAAGATSSKPVVLGAAGGWTYFQIASGNQIWRTDGTSQNTTPLSAPSGMNPVQGQGRFTAAVGNDLYFGTLDRLYRFSAQNATATQVAQISLRVNSAHVQQVTTDGSRVYMLVSDNTVWAYDPAGGGAIKVATQSSDTAFFGFDMTAMGGAVYFPVRATGTNFYDLWKTQGTPETTVLVKDLPNVSYYPADLATVGDTVYFSFSGVNQADGGLWKTDGTTAGTVQLKAIPTQSNFQPYNLTAVGDRLYFTDGQFVGGRLWTSDGTVAGTVAVPGGVLPEQVLFPPMVEFNGKLLYQGSSAAGGAEPWVSGGTAATTSAVADVFPGATGSAPQFLGTLGTQAIFAATDPVRGRELWVTDGTAAGTALLKDFRVANAGSQPGFTASLPNGKTVFSASDGQHGSELWVTDGTPGGTRLLLDIDAGAGNGVVYFPQTVGGLAFFVATDAAHGREVWQTDGTPEGTTVIDLASGPTSGVALGTTYVAVDRDYAYFIGAAGGQSGVWRTNGLPGGTTLAVPGVTTVPFYPVGGRILFNRTTPESGNEIWAGQGDGSPATLLMDINPGAASGNAALLTFPNPIYYVAADDGVHGRELWRTDGTPAGTWMVKDVNPAGSGVTFSVDQQFAMVDGQFYFVADDGVHGAELWRTDGTPGNATMVADIVPGAGSSRISRLVGARGKAFFFADDGVHGVEPWQSDGTAAGTTLVTDVVLGPGSPVVSDFRGAGGAYYFTADDGVHGAELWRTDGTAAGTVLYDTIPGPDGAAPSVLSVDARGNLFMTGLDPQAGKELFVLRDDVRPVVAAARFDYGSASHAITVRFSEGLATAPVAGDFVVTDRGTGATRTPASVAYDAATNTATLRFSTPLPDGNYRVAVAGAASVTDVAGNAAEPGWALEFFVLGGDVNRDRAVNFDDLLIVAKNYNKAGATFDQGDLTGDGLVNFDDLLVLAKAYNRTLAAPPSTVATAAVPSTAAAMLASPAAALGSRRDEPVFSTTRVNKAVAKPKPAPVRPAAARR